MKNAIIKCDTEQNWNKAKNYIPVIGTFIFYEYENENPKMKIADGKTKVSDLPFINLSNPKVEESILEL